MQLNNAKKVLAFFLCTFLTTLVSISGMCFTSSVSAYSEIKILQPSPGEVVSGYVSVIVNLEKKDLSLSLHVISKDGNCVEYSFSQSQGNYELMFNSKDFQNGTHYLYIVNDEGKVPLDSKVVSIVIDNTQPSLQAKMSSLLVRSGTLQTITLVTNGLLQSVCAIIDDDIEIQLNEREEGTKWETSYFVPYTMNEGTHLIKIVCKDQKGTSIQTDLQFMVCNSEPFFTSPSSGRSTLSESVVFEGCFKPGEIVYLYRNSSNSSSLVESIRADYQGNWISQPIKLTDGMNHFSVSAQKNDKQIQVFPSQNISLRYYQKGLLVLNYHDIVEEGNVFSRTPDQFKADMDYLLDNGFNFVTPTLYLSHIEGKAELPSKPVLITFDDGLSGAYKYAYPILKERGIEGFFFLLVSRVSTSDHYVTWEQCVEMQSSRVFSMESHTMNSHYFVDDHEGRHAALISRLPLPDGTVETSEQYLARVSEDLLLSKQIIEEKIQKTVNFLAIPFGYGNDDLNKIVRNAGYKGTFNSGGGINSLPLKNGWSVKRITVRKNDILSKILF